MNDIILSTEQDDGNTERLGAINEIPQIAQWNWVSEDGYKPWLGCVVFVGTNYVKLEGPADSGRGGYTARIHLDDVAEQLKHVPNAKEVLASRVAELQKRFFDLMGEANELTCKLGITQSERLQNQSNSTGTGLATISSQIDIRAYERDLVKAKTETLPAIHEKMKSTNEALAAWMAAEMIPLKAHAEAGKSVIEGMTDRLFNIELYAGLVEHAVKFTDGEPAGIDEKLRVFQRMLFCDEEALLGYESGGMELSDIVEFQTWLAKPENRDRILPYPRCMVAMRVRRKKKERDWEGSLNLLFKHMHLADGDMQTFLFVRNGEQLHRISTAIEFEELIFPPLSAFNRTDDGEVFLLES